MGALNSLTPREREVLDLLAEGQSNQEIADRLGIDEITVRNLHVQNIFSKLNVRNRTQAAMVVWKRRIEAAEAEARALREQMERIEWL